MSKRPSDRKTALHTGDYLVDLLVPRLSLSTPAQVIDLLLNLGFQEVRFGDVETPIRSENGPSYGRLPRRSPRSAVVPVHAGSGYRSAPESWISGSALR